MVVQSPEVSGLDLRRPRRYGANIFLLRTDAPPGLGKALGVPTLVRSMTPRTPLQWAKPLCGRIGISFAAALGSPISERQRQVWLAL